ncbi:hypothetical protein SDC9_55681 [bioreactor metagenome]|uniref:Uncharacterized protein n=1 Tax=bioreactor metagenome TaxID=1076179 RepID=A0A644X5F0_9ZZZZ
MLRAVDFRSVRRRKDEGQDKVDYEKDGYIDQHQLDLVKLDAGNLEHNQ